MTADAAAVLAAAERRARALVERDADELTRIHHPELRWTTRLGEVLDRDAYVRGNTERALAWRAQQLGDVEVVIAGETAILAATVVDEVEHDGRRFTFRLRVTQTWIRSPDGWLCLAGHASSPPEGM